MEIEKLGDWLIDQLESRKELADDDTSTEEVELLEEVAERYDFGEKQRAFEVVDGSAFDVTIEEKRTGYNTAIYGNFLGEKTEDARKEYISCDTCGRPIPYVDSKERHICPDCKVILDELKSKDDLGYRACEVGESTDHHAMADEYLERQRRQRAWEV